MTPGGPHVQYKLRDHIFGGISTREAKKQFVQLSVGRLQIDSDQLGNAREQVKDYSSVIKDWSADSKLIANFRMIQFYY